MALHAINLCDGYGGFSLALARFGVRTVARVERDSYAAAVLVERMGQARLDPCPVWDDLTTFDGAAWRGRVHLVTAGLPCQPFSAAGERRGVDDERHLWPYMRRIVADVGPEFVILENVPGFVRGGLPEVLGDLAALGFDAEWGLLSAADVGAPHRRERFWLVAHREDGRCESDPAFGGSERGRRQPYEHGHEDDVADPDRNGLPEVGHRIGGRQARDDADRRLPNVGDPRGTGRPEVARGPYSHEDAYGRQPHRDHVSHGPDEDVGHAERSRRQGCPVGGIGLRVTPETGSWPPLRDDLTGWADWIDQGGPQPVLRRDLDGPPAGLADALHLGGNGLVPQTAHEAIRQLLERGGWSL